MKTTLILLLVALGAQAQTFPSAEVQIKVALLACPEESREHAMVYGYSPKGEFLVLRSGTNEMVCIADDPASPGLSVSCYHKSLEPFMERGRVLKRQGKNFQEIFDIREQEAKSGKLILPKQPASLVVLTAAAEDYNATNGEVKNTYARSVVYIPFATAESTGLPTKPTTPGMPWIMNPGTARAHIMIDPPRKN
ncbi:MAG: hypothetical protein U0289_02170 [Cyclobacteriaceae bacterium]|nr:hypothetical protein [Cytophagales bacterium]HNP78500.1 hypothetical protein [Cyclobacteriaceae bacterium]